MVYKLDLLYVLFYTISLKVDTNAAFLLLLVVADLVPCMIVLFMHNDNLVVRSCNYAH